MTLEKILGRLARVENPIIASMPHKDRIFREIARLEEKKLRSEGDIKRYTAIGSEIKILGDYLKTL